MTPPVAFRFQVEIIGTPEAEAMIFMEVSGLVDEDSEKTQEGGENRIVHQLPKPVKTANLILKSGIGTVPTPLLTWAKDTLKSGLANPIEPKDLMITLSDESEIPVAAWKVSRAWPVELSMGDLDAMKNEVMIETIEFAYDIIARQT